MLFELFADCQKFFVGFRHFLFEHGNLVRRADARDDVFTLRVYKIFAVENVFAIGGVARKGNTCCARFAFISKDHRLDVYGSSPACGDIVFLAVDYRPLVHPRIKDSADCAPKLFVNVLREGISRAAFNECLVALYEFFKVVDGEVGVHFCADFGF